MTSPAIVRQTQFLVALAEAGIEPDIQELLVAGNPSRGIAPGALAKALAALDATPGEGWLPIADMTDKYDGIFLIAAPELVHGDWNPEGVNIGWWQDDEGWKSTAWNGTQDYSYDVIVNPTHFQRIKGPYSAPLVPECPASPLSSGKHQVDTSMESGPNNCFFCANPMPHSLPAAPLSGSVVK